jgi:hypothetical protein
MRALWARDYKCSYIVKLRQYIREYLTINKATVLFSPIRG